MTKSLEAYMGQVERDQLNKELTDIGVSEKRKEKLFQLFWKVDPYDSIISYRGYLDLFKNFLTQDDPNRNFYRSEFYTFLLSELIPQKRMRENWQKIAAAMEVLEANSLLPTEFDQLLKELSLSKDNINFERFLQNNLIQIGKDRYSKDETPRVHFFHHSIQEYLATEYILGSENPLKYLQHLAEIKEGNIVAIKPSWSNVIRFMLEIETEKKHKTPVLEWLLDLGSNYPDTNINESFAVAVTSVYSENISDDLKNQIYGLIYFTYRERLVWLPLWARRQLANFVTDEQIQDLKNQIKTPQGGWTSDKHRYVYLGFAAEMINNVLEYTPENLSREDREFWLEKLVEFANDKNENGVLQRNALHALEHYRSTDERFNIDLINKVSSTYQSKDELIKQVFIDFCSEVSPNSETTIELVSDAVVNRSLSIFGRYALYKINNFQGIQILLKKFIEKPVFFHSFLDQETIFNKDKQEKDAVLIDLIRQNADKLINEIESVLMKAYQLEDYWEEKESYFLNTLTAIANKTDPDYLQKLLKNIVEIPEENKRWHFFNGTIIHIAQIIRPEQVDDLFKAAEKIHTQSGVGIAQLIIRTARHRQGKNGESIYQYAKEKKYIADIPEQKTDNYEEKRNKKIVQEFKLKLEPEPGKYMTDVFNFYLEHEELLSNMPKEKEHLIKLVLNSGLKIDPREIKVTIPNKKERKFSISTTAQIYGDVLQVAKKLVPEELKKYRQNIIDFIPFAFTSDQNIIFELVPDLTDEELDKFVNKILIDTDSDVRYLVPSSYISLIEDYAKRGTKLKSAIPVLKNFIDDPDIPPYERCTSIETLRLLIDTGNTEEKKYLENIFQTEVKAIDNEEQQKLAMAANATLISVFHDRSAIKWRIEQTINRAFPYTPSPSGTVHNIGPFEEELDNLSFASPLLYLKDEVILISQIFKLIDAGFELLQKMDKAQYQSYAYYLWKVVATGVKEMAGNGFKPLNELKKYLEKYKENPEYNWWNFRFEDLNRVYATSKGKPKNILTAVEKVKERRQRV